MKKLFYTFLLISPLLFIYSCKKDIEGCMDSSAINYNSEATLNDNSCLFDSDGDGIYDSDEIIGCMDTLACNFDISATDEYYFSCEYPEQGYDCNGNWNLKVGDLYAGGIVFYIDETGFNGLISSMEDAGKFEWGCMTELGIFNTQIGSGYQNSWDIVNNCFEDSIAASVALAYVSGGYTDWFLPSKDELVEMYNTIGNGGPQGNIGAFEEDEGFDVGGDWNNNYWSSSEYSNTGAWGVDFLNGNTFNGNSKESPWRVRPIRCFGDNCSY